MSFTPSEMISLAKISMQKSMPFFSYLTMHLKCIPTKDDKIVPTMGVDSRWNMWYNENWVSKLSKEEVSAVVCHEVMHIALEHLKWLAGRDPRVANVAQDIVINDLLVTNGLHLPKDGIIPQNHEVTINGNIKIKDIDKKCWQMIYAELEKKLPKSYTYTFDNHMRDDSSLEDEKGKGGGQPSPADGQKPNMPGAGAGEQMTGKDALNNAYTYSKMQGKTPSGMDRLIDELNYPKMNWRELLQKFIIRELPFDFCYTRPSKKSISTGVFLPSIMRENLEICVGVDTSGSISPKDLKDALSEVYGIIMAYSNVKLTVLSCDAQVHTVTQVECQEDIQNLELKGGGGTSFVPVFDWIDENKPMTKLLIFFTDGYGDFPTETSIKTLWCVSQGGLELSKVPFGEAVSLVFDKHDEK